MATFSIIAGLSLIAQVTCRYHGIDINQGNQYSSGNQKNVSMGKDQTCLGKCTHRSNNLKKPK